MTLAAILALIEMLGSTASKVVQDSRAQTTAEEDANLARAFKEADAAHLLVQSDE